MNAGRSRSNRMPCHTSCLSQQPNWVPRYIIINTSAVGSLGSQRKISFDTESPKIQIKNDHDPAL